MSVSNKNLFPSLELCGSPEELIATITYTLNRYNETGTFPENATCVTNSEGMSVWDITKDAPEFVGDYETQDLERFGVIDADVVWLGLDKELGVHMYIKFDDSVGLNALVLYKAQNVEHLRYKKHEVH